MECEQIRGFNFSPGVIVLNRSNGIPPFTKYASAASGWHYLPLVIAIICDQVQNFIKLAFYPYYICWTTSIKST